MVENTKKELVGFAKGVARDATGNLNSGIKEELKSMMAEYMDAAGREKLEHITEETDFVNDLGMDSIDMVDVEIKLENQHGVEIKNENIAQLNTVGKYLDMMEKLM